MSNHQKRLSAPKSWPVERKTETFTVKADAGPHGEEGVPLLVLLRDVLGYADSRKEARYALNQDNVTSRSTGKRSTTRNGPSGCSTSSPSTSARSTTACSPAKAVGWR